MRLLLVCLTALLIGLQFKLWVADHGVPGVWRLKAALQEQQTENKRLRQRNEALEAEVLVLKHGSAAVEERARSDIGLIAPGETLFQLTGPEGSASEESGEP